MWQGARWYQPTTATFTARDSYAGELATPISLNRYTYGHNNPLRYFDPDGRAVELVDDRGSEATTTFSRDGDQVRITRTQQETYDKASKAADRRIEAGATQVRNRDGGGNHTASRSELIALHFQAEYNRMRFRDEQSRRTAALQAARGQSSYQAMQPTNPAPDAASGCAPWDIPCHGLGAAKGAVLGTVDFGRHILDNTVGCISYTTSATGSCPGPTPPTQTRRGAPWTRPWSPCPGPAGSGRGTETTTHTFDALGRQTQVAGPDGTVELTYDSLDRIATRNTTSFTYSGAWLDPTSDGSAVYAHSPSGRLLASRPPHRDADCQQGLRPLRPARGHLRLRAARRRFQGDYTDPTTDEVWQGARRYQPTTGVFTARDSYAGELATPMSLNRYTYGHNNPLRYFDPDGRAVCEGDACAGAREELGGREVVRMSASEQRTSRRVGDARRRSEVKQQAWRAQGITQMRSVDGGLQPISAQAVFEQTYSIMLQRDQLRAEQAGGSNYVNGKRIPPAYDRWTYEQRQAYVWGDDPLCTGHVAAASGRDVVTGGTLDRILTSAPASAGGRRAR